MITYLRVKETKTKGVFAYLKELFVDDYLSPSEGDEN